MACRLDPPDCRASSMRNRRCAAILRWRVFYTLATRIVSSCAPRSVSRPLWSPLVPEINPPTSDLFFELQVLCRDLRDHRPHPLDLRLVPHLSIVFSRRSVGIALQRYRRTALGHRPPAVENRRRQSVSPACLADRHPGLLRLAQNLNLLLSRKPPMFALAHKLRSVCRKPAAARSLSFPP